MYNCGMMALEMTDDHLDMLFTEFNRANTFVTADVENMTLTVEAEGKEKKIPFTLSGFDKTLIQTGGWVEYADQNY